MRATLTGVHFLLTYACTYECDHCFLHCSPRSKGTFTLEQLRNALSQIEDAGGVKSVYFEGGEPFLYYPLMVEGIRMARDKGFDVGVVTNAYWATAEEDARLWLKRLSEMGISDLSLSDDEFHSSGGSESPGKIAAAGARSLGMPAGTICIERPQPASDDTGKGEPITKGGAKIRGRAADKLAEGLPLHPAARFNECPYEELRAPQRVHVDPLGFVHLCQGLVIGNIWKRPLKDIVGDYDPESHPIAGPLLRGGPHALAREYDLPVEEAGYVDACHICYLARKALLGRFPEQLAPGQVYGIEEK
ncbi:radical SAM protein [Elusimicrobiota bacterium]